MGLPKIIAPEYSLILPSTGEELKYRPFLVKEEKLLLLAMESEDEKQIINATKNVIKNCVMGDIDPEQLPIFDIEYIFLWLRGRAKGEKIELKYKCPECSGDINVDLNLEDVKIDKINGHNNKIKLTDNVGIVMKYPNLMIQTKIEKINSETEIETLFKTVRLCIDYIFDNENTYPAKDHTEKELDEFLESLTDESFQELSKFFETMPKLEHTILLECKNPIKDKKKNTFCKHKEEQVLEGLSSFFA